MEYLNTYPYKSIELEIKNPKDIESQVVLTEIKYLCQTWLDEFEKDIFKGKTLSQILKNHI